MSKNQYHLISHPRHISDLIKNNLYRLELEPEKEIKYIPEGNLVVLNTLVLLFNQAKKSFDYTAQLNIYSGHDYTNPLCDVDINCAIDGKLIIGEAKYSSEGFFEKKSKSLKQLAEISVFIRPDKIVLSCFIDSRKGNLNSRLESAKKTLLGLLSGMKKPPEIECLIVNQASFQFNNASGYFYH